MNQHLEASKLAVLGLKKAIKKHESEDWFSIADDIDEFEILVLNEELKQNSLLYCVLQFWASWASCAEYTWEFEPEVQEHEWPELAKELLNNLKTNNFITNPKILRICQ